MDKQQLKTLILEELNNIAPEIDPDDLPENDDMREALELDSMDFLNLVVAVAKQTQIAIPEADYAQVLSLNAMIAYLLKAAH